MKIKKRYLFLSILLIIVVVQLGECFMSRANATRVAKEYIEMEFNQEMQFVRTVNPFRFVNGSRFRSHFVSVENPELEFHVSIIPNSLTVEGDTYFSKYFELSLSDYFAPSIAEVWGEDASLSVSVLPSNRFRLRTPANFNRQLPITETLEEMAEVFYQGFSGSYMFDFNVHISRTLDSISNKEHEANLIFMFIEILQNSNFAPNSVRVHYNKTNIGIVDRIINATQFEIRIRDWKNIENAEQVVALLMQE